MYTFMGVAFIIGVLTPFLYVKAHNKVINRLNYGEKVKNGVGDEAGYVVTIRFNGMKRYGTVVGYEMGGRLFHTKREARLMVLARYNGNQDENSRLSTAMSVPFK